MIFTELVLQNFGPYTGHHVIDLRPKILETSSPIVLFGGMNGGGKTTLIDAIRLALYGQRAQCSTRGNLSYSEFLSQSVNNQTSSGETTRIELALEHIVDEQWKALRIVRTWTKNPKDSKDSLGIINEEWPDTALANTWDEYIENLLPLGISNLFLFDGEQVKELAEQDSPPQAVVEAIQTLLGLELSERLAIDLDILVNRKRKHLVSSSQLANLEEIEGRLERYQQEAEIAKQQLVSLQSELRFAQKNHREAAEKFRIEGGKIASERTQLESKIEQISNSAENQREEMRHLAAAILPLGLIAPLLEQAKIQGQKELDIQQAKIAWEILQQRDKKLLDYLAQLSLTVAQLEKIQFFLEQENQFWNDEIKTSADPWLKLEPEEVKKIGDLLEHQLPIQINLAQRQLEKLKQLENELDATERQLAVAASPEEYEKLNKTLKKYQEAWIQSQAAYDAGKLRYEKAQKAIEKTKKELNSYSGQALARQNNEHLIQSITKVQETLKTFRERLTLKKLNKLEKEVTECFRYLLHKSDLVHRVAVDGQSYSLSLYDFQGKPVPKHRLSAGEKQLLAIAFLWGLARVSGRQLPIAIDTPLGRLDSSHRSHLVERYFPSASHQVILLSTDTEIGKFELEKLCEQEAIARQYLLKYDSEKRQTTIYPDRYFW